MADILHLAEVSATPEALYEALTTEEGLRSWWSEHSSAGTVVGSPVEVSFYGGMAVFKMRLAELEPVKKVVWNVEGGPPDWVGTTITWTISQQEGKTMLHLAHRGFANMEGNFAGVNYTWGWYITSLVFLMKNGKGMPHTDADMG